MEPHIEQFLLFRIRAFQDQKAFESLIAELGPKVDKFLRLRLPRHEDVEDVYADVWEQFWTYAKNTKVDSSSGLVFTIARARIAHFYQRRERRPEVFATTAENEVDAVVDLQDELINRIDVDFLKQYMLKLSDKDAQLIQMRYLEGYRVKDIAKQFSTSENSISVTLNRAINKLRKLVREQFDDSNL